MTSRSRFGDHTVRRKPVGCEVDKTQSPFVTGDGVWSKARRAVSWLSGVREPLQTNHRVIVARLALWGVFTAS